MVANPIRPRARRAGITAILLVLGGGAAGVAAQSGDSPVPSDQADALDTPETWDCRRIEPEYRRWLGDGNRADNWKFAGKTYRDVETGRLYTWQDWLNWADDAGCLAGGSQAGGIPTSNVLIGGAVVALGATLVTASGGSDSKSPG